MNPGGVVMRAPSGTSTQDEKYTYFLDFSLKNWGLPSGLSWAGASFIAVMTFDVSGKTLDDGAKLGGDNYCMFPCRSKYNFRRNVSMFVNSEDKTKMYFLFGTGVASGINDLVLTSTITVSLWSMSEKSFIGVPSPTIGVPEINIYY